MTVTKEEWNRMDNHAQAQMWRLLPEGDKVRLRSDAGLTRQLVGLEGCRVEAVTTYGETRRFWVSRSTGWVPCHIEIKRLDSGGGHGADSEYASVRVVRRPFR